MTDKCKETCEASLKGGNDHVNYADSKGAEAGAARDLTLDGTYFGTVWSAFVQRMTDRAAGKEPAASQP